MILNAAGAEVTRWNQRAIGVAVITLALLVHGLIPKWGLRFQNLLGVFKIAVLVVIIISGFVALGGHVKAGAPHPSNFTNAFAGTKSDANSFVNAMYNVSTRTPGITQAAADVFAPQAGLCRRPPHATRR